MKVKSYFLGKIRKFVNLSSAELPQRVVRVNYAYLKVPKSNEFRCQMQTVWDRGIRKYIRFTLKKKQKTFTLMTKEQANWQFIIFISDKNIKIRFKGRFKHRSSTKKESSRGLNTLSRSVHCQNWFVSLLKRDLLYCRSKFLRPFSKWDWCPVKQKASQNKLVSL